MESISCSYFHHWNYLPNEIKSMVIRNMTNNSRLSLRACSKSNQELVDYIPFRKIFKLSIHNNEGNWSIDITNSAYDNEITSKFATFDAFQKKLTQEIENSDFIQEMAISNTYIEKPLNLLRFGKLAKAGKIFFNKRSVHSKHILEQINTGHLKKLEFSQKTFDPAVLNMDQILHSSLSIVGINYIRDDQLLKFEGSEIFLRNSKMLTDSGINKFLRKCVDNLDMKQIYFRIACDGTNSTEFMKDLDIASSKEDEKVSINSPSGNLQLKIEYSDGFVSGKTIVLERNRKNGSFETIESIQIDRLFPTERSLLIIENRNGGRVHYEFESAEDLQRKLTEELEGIIYVKEITIHDPTYPWKLTSSNKDRIAVGILTLSGGNYEIDYLKQIEPIHLKEISIAGRNENEKIYDLPQVIHAEKLGVTNSHIRADQLLQLNVKRLELQINNQEDTCNLTDSGINAFVKRSLHKLNKHDLYFSIYSSGKRRSTSALFDGLDCSSQQRLYELDKEAIVNSLYPEYQLELTSYSESFIGKRVRNELL